MRRLIVAVVAALVLALGAAACDSSNAFCYGEGGQVQGCTSQGSPGQ